MAATWIKPIHLRKGSGIKKTISNSIDYVQNSDKTVDKPIENLLENNFGDSISSNTSYAKNPSKSHDEKYGTLVKGYACDPRTVDAEFILAKKEYEYLTGRSQGNRDILAYHVRQSFKPGEIEPQKALEVGYETAMRFLKGKHQFIVAVHTDKAHIHCHIIFNSTSLDCRSKFKNFYNSSFALQRLSDLICLENGLSVIEKPKPSKGRDYGKWLGDKTPSWQDKLRLKIDEVLPSCKTFDEFISTMKSSGYKVNTDRKHITFLAEGQKKPTRLNTLRGNYTEEAIRERIVRQLIEVITPNSTTKDAPLIAIFPANVSTVKISWLIDIQAKIKEGKGEGYENWAHIFNIKEAAKTLLYLKEQGVDSYDELIEKTSKASTEFSNSSTEIKDIETRIKAIAELQRQIGTYGKTREVYNAYTKSGFNKDFYEANRANIALHEAAKNHFNSLGIKKLPKISELKQEYAELTTQKKKLYVDYHATKKQQHDLLIAKDNSEKILGITSVSKNHVTSQVTSTEKNSREAQGI